MSKATDLLNPKKAKKVKKKVKKKKKPSSSLEKLLSKKLPGSALPPVPELSVTDLSNTFLRALENIYSAAHSSGYAAAVMELRLLHEELKNPDGDGGEEVFNRFDRSKFESLYEKLLELKSIQELGEAFGLEGRTIDLILATKVQSLFGSSLPSGASRSFVGDEAQLLSHLVKKKLLASKGQE